MTTCSYGYRLVGSVWEKRRLVDWAAAFSAYCACDDRADVQREAYLSAFTFAEEFSTRADAWGFVETARFTGACWSPWLWFDIDREQDLDAALTDTRKLVAGLLGRFTVLDEEDLLLFYSGSKGFHVGLPTCIWGPEPGVNHHRRARRFAEGIATRIGVSIDAGVYDKVRAFRAPNSRHAKTGRHKRRLTFAELMGLNLGRILQFAERPEPFDVPSPDGRCERAAADWLEAVRAVEADPEAKAQRRAINGDAPTLNRVTLEIIRDYSTLGTPQDTGNRRRLLYSAARNLGEFRDHFRELVHHLLTESGLDSGISPKDVHRQIECGLDDSALACAPEPRSSFTEDVSPQGESPALPNPPDLQAQLAALWKSSPPPTPRAQDAMARADAAELQAERDAIQAEGRPRVIVTPPPGTKLFFEGDNGKACAAGSATRWTWEGAPRWFAVIDHPIPFGTPKGGQTS